MKIEYTITNGLVGCSITDTVEVEDHADDDAIEATIEDLVMERINWSWSRKDD